MVNKKIPALVISIYFFLSQGSVFAQQKLDVLNKDVCKFEMGLGFYENEAEILFFNNRYGRMFFRQQVLPSVYFKRQVGKNILRSQISYSRHDHKYYGSRDPVLTGTEKNYALTIGIQRLANLSRCSFFGSFDLFAATGVVTETFYVPPGVIIEYIRDPGPQSNFSKRKIFQTGAAIGLGLRWTVVRNFVLNFESQCFLYWFRQQQEFNSNRFSSGLAYKVQFIKIGGGLTF